MKKETKKRKNIKNNNDFSKTYSPVEAIKILKENSYVKFNETLEIAINLKIDTEKTDQNIRGVLNLPKGSGKKIKVAVMAKGNKATEATDAGADIVGLDDLAEKVKNGDIDFDVVIATPESMRVVGQLGRVLGPRGLMPNPKTGTVTADVETAVNNASAGQVQFRADRGGIVHGSVGKVGFEPSQIKQNIEALINDLKKAKPASAKGIYLQKITLSSTMGPGLLIDETSLEI